MITVHGEDELAACTRHLFSGVAEEFVCAATDLNTWSRPETRAAIASRVRPAVRGGLTVRKLYTAAALADEAQRTHLLDLAAVPRQPRIGETAAPF